MTITDSHRDPHAATDRAIAEKNASLITLIVHSTKVFSSTVSDIVSQQGHSLDEWMVLDAIHRNNGSSMSEISAASGCYGATLTRAVDKLVAGALVYREASPTDRRKVVVFIADSGREVHSEISSRMIGVEASVAQALESAGLSMGEFSELMENLPKLGASLIANG